MRILMLGWELPPHNSGGLGVACFHMAKALAHAGAEIDFVLPYKAQHKDASFMKVHHTSDDIPVYKTGFGAYNSHAGGSAQMKAIQKTYTSYVKRYLKKNRPDVIHAHDWLTFEAGVAAKKVSNIPLVVHVHATEFDRAGSNRGNPIIHDIEQEGLLMADRIIAVSSFTKRLIVDKYHIPADKVEVIHNSIDASSVYELEATDTYAYASRMKQEGYLVVSTLGRLTVQKGLDRFLRGAALACEAYDKFLFIIAGDGEQRDELLRLSADLGISDRVLFTGFVRGQKWRDVYHISDVFVMSSVSEPFGLTALEAAANETSLIISRQSGVGEVLHNILRYDYWDEQRLADQLINLASSSGLRHELSTGAKREFDRFSWAQVADRCFHQYERARVSA